MRTFFHFWSEWQTDDGPSELLVIFNSSRTLDVQEMLGIIDNEIQTHLRPDEIVLITREDTFATDVDTLRNETVLEILKGRLGEECNIAVWGFSETGHISKKIVLQAGSRLSGASFAELIRRGGTSIFNEHRGFVEGSETYHFQNPSGKHTDRFIRLSNILVKQAEISFLAVSLLPLLPLHANKAYIDTPSLYTILAAANQHRDQGGLAQTIVADNFRSYFGLEGHSFTEIETAVAVISASSSGSMAAKVAAKGFAPNLIAHLLYLGKIDDGIKVALNLAIDEIANPEGHSPERRTFDGDGGCQLCKNGSLLIELKGDQFDVSPPQPKALIVKRDHAPDGLFSTINRIVGNHCLSVNAKTLHHVDFKKLCLLPNYSTRLDFFIRRFIPAKITHCILLDEDSNELAKIVERHVGSEMKLVRADKSGEIENKIQNDKGPLLVVAAAIGNGRSLLDVSRELRTAAPLAPITYFVGFAKPSSINHRKTLKNSLIFSNQGAQHAFEVVDELVLPSAARENAWASELDFMNETKSRWPDQQANFVEQRIAELSNTSAPLINNLFVPNQDANPLGIRPGFAFWPKGMIDKGGTQADVFATISTVLQTLRTRPPAAKEEALRSGWFRQTLIDPEVFGRFNDGIIQGSFLRAALPSELDYRSDPELSMAAAKLIRKMIEGAKLVRGEGAYEFLLAIGCLRLRLLDDHRRFLFSESTVSRARVRSLLSIVKKKLEQQV